MSFRFLHFKVYHDGKTLYRTTIHITGTFSPDYRHLGEQMRRASLSIILNIAEGSGKTSDRDFNRYLQNALGSVNELAATYDIAHSQSLITGVDYALIEEKLLEIQRQLGGFSKQLRVER